MYIYMYIYIYIQIYINSYRNINFSGRFLKGINNKPDLTDQSINKLDRLVRF